MQVVHLIIMLDISSQYCSYIVCGLTFKVLPIALLLYLAVFMHTLNLSQKP